MEKIIISAKDSGTRIDKFLASAVAQIPADKREFFSYSRAEIVKNIRAGNILVNGGKVKPSYIIRENDLLSIALVQKRKEIIANKNVKFGIIYQDKNIVAVDKPIGLKVHPAGFDEDNTLVNGLLAKFPEIKNVTDGSFGAELRPGIVHRLDKDTSGIMVVARNQKIFDELKKLFQERKVKKKYLAAVFGHLKEKEGLIAKPLARAKSYKKQIIAHRKTRTKIRPAQTAYKVLKEYKKYSLVEAMPQTGRTHQIRVHLFSLGNPVVGDERYRLKGIAGPKEIKRQLLHAEKLAFTLGGRKYSFRSPLPADFAAFLASLD